MKVRNWMGMVGVWLLVGATSGCQLDTESPEQEPVTCQQQGQCASDSACLGGECQTVTDSLSGALACNARQDCPAAALCADGHCLAADGDQANSCAAHSDCPNDYACISGHCIYFGAAQSADVDGDGHAADTDCDDSNAAIYPGAAEACDGVDNDCNGQVDEGCQQPECLAAADCGTCADCVDGTCIALPCLPCQSDAECPSDHVCVEGNCVPLEPQVEICDGIDNDLDGVVDEGCTTSDADADGFAAGEDCDDTNAAINPAMAEICDSLDNNCNGQVDEGCEQPACQSDADCGWCSDCVDGTCIALPCLPCQDDAECPSDHVCMEGNCVPLEPQVEICDGIDNDLDGVVDEGCTTFDADADGFAAGEDCDDTNAAINPAMAESCDGLDNNCNGQVDEGCEQPACQSDLDCGPCAGCVEGMCIALPCLTCESDSDCPEGLACVFDPQQGFGQCQPFEPQAEICGDGLDNDLDGLVDEGCATTDLDGDGFAAEEDCDDSNPAVNPAMVEICDGLDNDCDGQADEGC